MLSKRVAVCLYRCISRQVSVTQQHCGCKSWRSVFVRSRSNITDEQTTDSTVKIGQESVDLNAKRISTQLSNESIVRLIKDEDSLDVDEAEKNEDGESSLSYTTLVKTNGLSHHGDADISMKLYSEDGETHEIGPASDDDGSVVPLMPKTEFKPVYNVAPYVKESTTLTNLVNIGVSLAEVEKKKGAINAIVKMDFKKEIQPVLLFLAQIGVGIDKIGIVITKNPYLLLEDLDNLQTRINYFRSKKFSSESISSIVTRNPKMLSMKVERIDAKLGYLQKGFMLKGNEVRQTVTKCPFLFTRGKDSIEEIRVFMQDNCGFTRSELKTIFVANPRVYLTAEKMLEANFDFLHNVMGLSHKDIILWPQIFRTRPFIITQRHRFLLSLGRAQYDPTKENYISLRDLVKGRDEEFCENVAKSTIQQFNDFIKTL